VMKFKIVCVIGLLKLVYFAAMAYTYLQAL
jgi:hypothetical protein